MVNVSLNQDSYVKAIFKNELLSNEMLSNMKYYEIIWNAMKWNTKNWNVMICYQMNPVGIKKYLTIQTNNS